jgi:ferritin-like metal-binding protein YciE
MQGTYFKNNETGRLHYVFDKQDYKQLPSELQSRIKRFCLFSKTFSCWVSKSTNDTYYAKTLALDLGLTKGEDIGTFQGIEQKINTQIEKAENRIERFDSLIEKNNNESKANFKSASNMLAVLPMGQPILVGHHSEKRHRALIEKGDSVMRKGLEHLKKAEYYDNRSDSSSNFVAVLDKNLKNVHYLTKKIKENSDKIALLERALKNPLKGNRIDEVMIETKDKLDFYTKKLEELKDSGTIIFDKENLKDKKIIHTKNGKYVIAKLNRTTVSVKTGYSWLDKIEYTKIIKAE